MANDHGALVFVTLNQIEGKKLKIQNISYELAQEPLDFLSEPRKFLFLDWLS